MISEEKTDLLEIARQLQNTPPELDTTTRAALGFYELSHSLAKVYPMQMAPVGSKLKAMRADIEAELLASGSAPEKTTFGIPRVPASAIADPEFAECIKEPCPFIFEGASRDTAALAEWSPEFFIAKYGEYPCYIAK